MFNRFVCLLMSLRLLPHLIVYYSTAANLRSLLDYERDRWLSVNALPKKGLRGFLYLLNMFPEYRSLFYHRTRSEWLNIFAKGQTSLYFHTPSDKIGKGLVIWHGYSTVINAVSIGEDCEIWHLVTIGKQRTEPGVLDKPIIGNNVKVCTGSICIGAIRLCDRCTVAAGSIVVRDVYEGRMVRCLPACENGIVEDSRLKNVLK